MLKGFQVGIGLCWLTKNWLFSLCSTCLCFTRFQQIQTYLKSESAAFPHPSTQQTYKPWKSQCWWAQPLIGTRDLTPPDYMLYHISTCVLQFWYQHCKYTEKMPTLALLKAPVRSSTFYQSIEKPFKHIVCVHIAGASRCLLRILCICHSLTVSMSILRNPNYLHLTKTARARRAEHRALISAE